MKVRCLNCNHSEFEAFKVYVTGLGRGEIACSQCGSLHKNNFSRMLVAFLFAGVAVMAVLIAKPKYDQFWLRAVVYLGAYLLVYAPKPLALVSSQVKPPKSKEASQLKWYSSPIFWVTPIFLTVLYFMFVHNGN